MNEPAAWWRLVTPPLGAGAAQAAIAVIELTGDVEWALGRLAAAAPASGGIALRNLAQVDRGIVARPRPDLAYLMPHAGPLILDKLKAALREAGLREAPANEQPSFPEAASDIESRMLTALQSAASPLAIDLLLDQPRRWSTYGGDPADPVLLARSRHLRHLLHPPTIVLLGAPNIGKSSLLNSLARRSVSLVADEPGTTRDHVGVAINFAGLVANCLDAPGIQRGGVGDPVQAEAQRLALEAAQRADLILWCGDAGAPFMDHLLSPPRSLRIGLRADLGEPHAPADVAVSAHTGAGMTRLVELVRDRLVPRDAIEHAGPWRFWD